MELDVLEKFFNAVYREVRKGDRLVVRGELQEVARALETRESIILDNGEELSKETDTHSLMRLPTLKELEESNYGGIEVGDRLMEYDYILGIFENKREVVETTDTLMTVVDEEGNKKEVELKEINNKRRVLVIK